MQLRGTPGDLANRTSFREFMVNVQEFRVYMAMLGNQTHVSMIHTPGVYYFLASATSTYQGKGLAFIGDRRAAKEPTPICLPTTKTWEWHTGDAVMDFEKFSECGAIFGRLQLGTGSTLNSWSQIFWPSRICSSISSGIRGWQSHHTMYWPRSTICPREWRTWSSLGVCQEVVPGGRPSERQREKQGVS